MFKQGSLLCASKFDSVLIATIVAFFEPSSGDSLCQRLCLRSLLLRLDRLPLPLGVRVHHLRRGLLLVRHLCFRVRLRLCRFRPV